LFGSDWQVQPVEIRASEKEKEKNNGRRVEVGVLRKERKRRRKLSVVTEKSCK
jgi:hypothetical protein